MAKLSYREQLRITVGGQGRINVLIANLRNSEASLKEGSWKNSPHVMAVGQRAARFVGLTD